eukprot:310108_1
MIVLFLLFGIIANGQDYQLSVNESAIEKIKDHFVPFFHDFILNKSIPSQTITGTVNVDVDNITIATILHDEIVINLDSKHQSIHLHMNNIDILFNTFEFEAYKTIIWKLSCYGYAAPEIQNYNISFSVDVLHDDNTCTFSVDLDPTSIIISEGNTWLNTEFNSDACQTLYEVGDFLLDIEDEIHQKIIDEIPEMIEEELQILMDELLEQMQWVQIQNHTFIEICYQNIHINDHDLYIEADFIFNDTSNKEYYSDPSTTYAMYTKSDDFSLLIGIIIYGIILFFCGICIGSLIMCCVYRKKRTRWKNNRNRQPIPSCEYNETSSQHIEIEQYPLNQNTN